MYGCFACVYAMTLHHVYSRCPQNLREGLDRDQTAVSCHVGPLPEQQRCLLLNHFQPHYHFYVYVCVGGCFISMSVHHEDAVPVGARRGRWSYRLLSCKQVLGLLGPLEE